MYFNVTMSKWSIVLDFCLQWQQAIFIYILFVYNYSLASKLHPPIPSYQCGTIIRTCLDISHLCWVSCILILHYLTGKGHHKTLITLMHAASLYLCNSCTILAMIRTLIFSGWIMHSISRTLHHVNISRETKHGWDGRRSGLSPNQCYAIEWSIDCSLAHLPELNRKLHFEILLFSRQKDKNYNG